MTARASTKSYRETYSTTAILPSISLRRLLPHCVPWHVLDLDSRRSIHTGVHSDVREYEFIQCCIPLFFSAKTHTKCRPP